MFGWPEGTLAHTRNWSWNGQRYRGAGNNRAMSTATVSSFLNAAGRLGGWSAWPERVVGVTRPLGGLAARVSLGLPCVQARSS